MATLLESRYVQVLVAMMLGVIVGRAWPTASAMPEPLGGAFIGLVRIIVAPIVFLHDRIRHHVTAITGRQTDTSLPANRPQRVETESSPVDFTSACTSGDAR